MHIAYLSLGSNLGDRMLHLQKACDLLSDRAGVIRAVSPVYNTESWGFNAAAFLNIAVELHTPFAPEKLLAIIRQIENECGRTRSEKSGYTSRSMDIDILYYENLIIDKAQLTVPHPLMSERKFVLVPLADIAPDYVCPQTGLSVKEMLDKVQDDSSVIKLNKRIRYNEFLHHDYSYIAIEGNIGAGKTTLTHFLASDFSAKTVLERFADNPFLPKFYKDNERYAFPLEMSFLADRFQQLSDDLGQFDLFKNFIISDYYIFKSLIFAGVTLGKDEYLLYRKIFNVMYKDITKPDLYIYLYQSTDRLLENIRKRGREYEQNIDADYLSRIHEGYNEFIKSQKDLNILIIDVTETDFVRKPEDYWRIIQMIKGHRKEE